MDTPLNPFPSNNKADALAPCARIGSFDWKTNITELVASQHAAFGATGELSDCAMSSQLGEQISNLEGVRKPTGQKGYSNHLGDYISERTTESKPSRVLTKLPRNYRSVGDVACRFRRVSASIVLIIPNNA